MSATVAWRDSELELHKFVRRIHDLFAPEANRKWLLDQIREYVDERVRAEKSKDDWYSRRRKYFEVDVFKRGMTTRRDRQSACGDDYEWVKYSRRLEPNEADSIPAALKRSYFTTFDLRFGKEVPRRVKCFEQSGGIDWIYVHAWTPKDLVTFNEVSLSSLPLPPKDGREYKSAEICMALAILHASDGAFASLIPADWECADAIAVESFWEEALVTGIEGHAEFGATSSWIVSLEPLLSQISLALRATSNCSAANEEQLVPTFVIDHSVARITLGNTVYSNLDVTAAVAFKTIWEAQGSPAGLSSKIGPHPERAIKKLPPDLRDLVATIKTKGWVYKPLVRDKSILGQILS